MLNYLEEHKQYQDRSNKYISDIDNLMKSELVTLDKANNEILRSIFSMLDDLVIRDESFKHVLSGLLREESKKDDDMTPQEIETLKQLIERINSNNSVERFSLFDLENQKIIKNFSFAKQSKFFDM